LRYNQVTIFFSISVIFVFSSRDFFALKYASWFAPAQRLFLVLPQIVAKA
jgi:hypothetical protein